MRGLWDTGSSELGIFLVVSSSVVEDALEEDVSPAPSLQSLLKTLQDQGGEKKERTAGHVLGGWIEKYSGGGGVWCRSRACFGAGAVQKQHRQKSYDGQVHSASFSYPFKVMLRLCSLWHSSRINKPVAFCFPKAPEVLSSQLPPVRRMPGVCLEQFAELCPLVSRLLEDKTLVL